MMERNCSGKKEEEIKKDGERNCNEEEDDEINCSKEEKRDRRANMEYLKNS